MNKRTHNQGNVLFLILIAVALFAALSYVIVNSSRSGAGSISQEDAKLVKAQMDNIVLGISNAVLNKRLKTNCTLDDLESNFCPPTPIGCSWIARPECNIVAVDDPFAPKVRWENSASQWYLYLTGGKRMIVWIDKGKWSDGDPTNAKILYVSFFFDNYTGGYYEPAGLRRICDENNAKSGLPAMDVIGGYSDSTYANFLAGVGMKAATCMGAADNNWMEWQYPISRE